MKSKLSVGIITGALVVLVSTIGTTPHAAMPIKNMENMQMGPDSKDRFAYLSTHGNSACSLDFQKGIPAMSDEGQIQGSCCSPMSLHRYEEQIEAIKKYKDISEIPSDPYDVSGDIAKKMYAYYDVTLTPEEQAAYDYAMEHSEEKGPCCCKCWHYFTNEGIAKKMIKDGQFNSKQIADYWDASDICGA